MKIKMGMLRQTNKADMIALSFGFFSRKSRRRPMRLYKDDTEIAPVVVFFAR